MNDATKGMIVWGGILVAGIAVGLGIGWKLWSPKPTKAETYAPAISQQDGSLVLERKPQPDAKPAHELPKGAKLERVVQVTVQPHQPAAGPVSPLPSGSDASVPAEPERPPCPPVRVDLSLVRMPDLTRRVIASSPDGQVVGGVDIPVESARPQKQLKWAAGGLWNPADRTFGAFVDRDMGPLRAGVEAFQQRRPVLSGGGVEWAAQIKLGIRF